MTDDEMRAAILAWTRARLRWKEFLLCDIGTPRYVVLLAERPARHQALVDAEAVLLRIGNQLLLGDERITSKGEPNG
jgi:hypothetical protein